MQIVRESFSKKGGCREPRRSWAPHAPPGTRGRPVAVATVPEREHRLPIHTRWLGCRALLWSFPPLSRRGEDCPERPAPGARAEATDRSVRPAGTAPGLRRRRAPRRSPPVLIHSGWDKFANGSGEFFKERRVALAQALLSSSDTSRSQREAGATDRSVRPPGTAPGLHRRHSPRRAPPVLIHPGWNEFANGSGEIFSLQGGGEPAR